MKLSSVLPLVVAAGFSVPTNGAIADEPQVQSDVSDRVNFDPDSGELTLHRPDELSSAGREEAVTSVLGDFRQLVDGCLESGTPGDVGIAPKETEFTVDCGDGGPVVSCVFKEGAHVTGVACEYPNGGIAGLTLETSVERRKIPGLTGDCGLHFGCMEEVTTDTASLSGTGTVGGPNGGEGPVLTLRRSKTEINNRGDIGGLDGWDLGESSAGPDSFGAKREGDTGLMDGVGESMSTMREGFSAKLTADGTRRMWTPRREGRQY